MAYYNNYNDKADSVVFWVTIYDKDKLNFENGKFIPTENSIVFKNEFADQPAVFKHDELQYDSLTPVKDGCYAKSNTLFLIRNHAGIWTLSVSSNNKNVKLVEDIKFYQRFNKNLPDENKYLANALNINDIMESCIRNPEDESAKKNICAEFKNTINGEEKNLIAFITLANVHANDEKTNIFTIDDDKELFKEKLQEVKKEHREFSKMMFETILPLKEKKSSYQLGED